MRKIILIFVIVSLVGALFYGLFDKSYQGKVKVAYSLLDEGVSLKKIEKAFEEIKLIKKQTVRAYTIEDLNKLNDILNSKMSNGFSPANLAKRLISQDEIEVDYYMIRKRVNIPYGFVIEYISVFKDIKNNTLVGWGKGSSWAEIRTWGDSL